LSADTTYGKQDRGSAAAYESYFAGMDSSMQQKVALTTAHFPVRGRIADMGSGSGRGTFDLASLYDGLELVGVDVNPISVERAREKFQRANLSYLIGDISQMVFPANSLDGILDSSVLHHVTSFNNFDVNRVLTTLDNQVAQLKPRGVIIIRDFVIPDGPEHVFLDLPTADGTAALFEVFARDWRSSVNPDGPVPFASVESPRHGFVRFQLALRAAAEFVLRKDYRADWDTEVLEEYTYLSQAQFEAAFRARGLRIVTSRPLWNPWIVRNRFEKKFYLSDLDDRPLPFPPTNYLIVGEKVDASEGVELCESRNEVLAAPKFLKLSAYRHKETGEVWELVERPHQTIDILPWIDNDGQILVLAKKDFPRPLVNACAEQVRLAGASLSGYITEPISAIVEQQQRGQAALPDLLHPRVVTDILRERANLSEADVISIGEPHSYFTSPGAINELVMACLVQVRPQASFSSSSPNYTSFASAGTVRELDAQQVLRASHVGGMFDARLEINIYRLLHELGRSCGPWIGAPIKLSEQAFESDVLSLSPRSAFESCEMSTPQFLSVRDGTFLERTRSGEVISEVAFEYVVPQKLSASTVTVMPVVKTQHSTYVGVELRDLPAVQSFSGSSRILTIPAWRLPLSLHSIGELPSFITAALQRDFALTVRNVWELGGSYFSSPGVTPEVVYPFVAEVDATSIRSSQLHSTDLATLNPEHLHDAHLLISTYRLRHALKNTR